MPDREKAIRILEGNYKNFVLCHNGELLTVNELIALLKAQEPRVMTLDEVKSCGNPVWLEWNYTFIKPALLHSEEVMTDDNRNAVTFVLFGDEEWYIYADDDYGKEIRCWTSRPTEAEREAIPWRS